MPRRLFGRDARGFVTGSSFDPVTTGVDVAAKRLPSGGSLVLLDCRGPQRNRVRTRGLETGTSPVTAE